MEPVVPTGGWGATGWSWVRDPASALARLDTADLAVRLGRLSQEKWWLRPVSFVGVALLGLTGAVGNLVRNWRLVLLEIVPAVWLGAITWQWRRVVLFEDDLPVVRGGAAVAVAVLVLVATSASYWCNVTFALTVGRPESSRIRSAFDEARRRARWVWAAALATAALHAAVVVWVARTDTSWFALSLGVVALIQMYAFVAVPVVIATGRLQRRPLAERLQSAAASLGVSGVTSAPGLLFNRIGALLLGIGWLRWAGHGARRHRGGAPDRRGLVGHRGAVRRPAAAWQPGRVGGAGLTGRRSSDCDRSATGTGPGPHQSRDALWAGADEEECCDRQGRHGRTGPHRRPPTRCGGHHCS